jgi:hypothetical protein
VGLSAAYEHSTRFSPSVAVSNCGHYTEVVGAGNLAPCPATGYLGKKTTGVTTSYWPLTRPRGRSRRKEGESARKEACSVPEFVHGSDFIRVVPPHAMGGSMEVLLKS